MKNLFARITVCLLIPCLAIDPALAMAVTGNSSTPIGSMVAADAAQGRFRREAFAMRALGMLQSFSKRWGSQVRRRMSVRPWAIVQPAGSPGPVFLSENSGEDAGQAPDSAGLAERFGTELLEQAGRQYHGLPLDLNQAYGLVSLLDHDAAFTFANFPLRNPSLEQWRQFYFAGMHVLINRGRILSFDPTPTSMTVQRGTIDPQSWNRISYLGSAVFAADVEWTQFHGRISAGYDEFAFVDPGRAKANAANVYRDLANSFLLRGVFEQAAHHWLSRSKVNTSLYAELCGYQRLRQVAIRQAKDHVYATLRTESRSFQVSAEDLAYVLVKPQSFLEEYVSGEEYQSPEARIKVGAVILMFAGHLGGIIEEMEGLLKNASSDRQRDLAYAIFVDYLVEQHTVYDLDYAQTQERDTEGMASHLLFGSIADSLGGKPSARDILDQFEGGPEHPADRALRFIKTIYKSHFYDDDERREILGLAPAPAESIPPAGSAAALAFALAGAGLGRLIWPARTAAAALGVHAGFGKYFLDPQLIAGTALTLFFIWKMAGILAARRRYSGNRAHRIPYRYGADAPWAAYLAVQVMFLVGVALTLLSADWGLHVPWLKVYGALGVIVWGATAVRTFLQKRADVKETVAPVMAHQFFLEHRHELADIRAWFGAGDSYEELFEKMHARGWLTLWRELPSTRGTREVFADFVVALLNEVVPLEGLQFDPVNGSNVQLFITSWLTVVLHGAHHGIDQAAGLDWAARLAAHLQSRPEPILVEDAEIMHQYHLSAGWNTHTSVRFNRFGHIPTRLQIRVDLQTLAYILGSLPKLLWSIVSEQFVTVDNVRVHRAIEMTLNDWRLHPLTLSYRTFVEGKTVRPSWAFMALYYRSAVQAHYLSVAQSLLQYLRENKGRDIEEIARNNRGLVVPFLPLANGLALLEDIAFELLQIEKKRSALAIPETDAYTLHGFFGGGHVQHNAYLLEHFQVLHRLLLAMRQGVEWLPENPSRLLQRDG